MNLTELHPSFADLPVFAYIVLFVLSSLLIVWRLECLTTRGLTGTVLGTLFMPYFSGLGNLLFVYILLANKGFGHELATNVLTNNVTNLCVLISLPALIWGLDLRPVGKSKKIVKGASLNRLSLILTLVALLFFSGVTYILSDDGWLDRIDGLVLIAVFVFWQCFHIYEVLKENTQSDRSTSPMLFVDVGIILFGSLLSLLAIDNIVTAIVASEGSFFNSKQLGLLTGFLMVLPNAFLAFYYAARKRSDIVYASQVGDAHICVPLCVGLFAVFHPIASTGLLQNGLLLLVVLGALHLVSVIILNRLPRILALGLLIFYGWLLSSNLGFFS